METNKKSEKSFWKELGSWIFDIVFVILIAFLIITFVGQRTSVIGKSMEPTLHNGDHLIIDKISYRFTEPKRFDIVVFPYPMNPKLFYIKRVIGLPGETVQIKDGLIYINGELLEEEFGNELIISSGLASEPVEVKEGEYFLLGDNRNNSSDSRYMDVGNIQRKDIVGKAWLRIYPLSQIEFLKHQ